MDPSGYCHRKGAGLLPLAAALPLYVGSAVEWPPDFVRSSRLQLKVLAPSKPHRLEASVRPTKASPLLLRHSLTNLLASRGSSSLRLRSPRLLSVPWLPSTPLFTLHSPHSFQDQALDRLVSPSSTRYRASTDDLSTLSSSRGLTCLMQWQFYSLGGLHA